MSRQTASLLLGLLLASSALAQDLAKKVTFASPAASAKVMLKDLSTATGVPMDAYPTTAGEVLLVKVKDVTVDELMKRIAAAIDGDWEKVGGTYWLGRAPGTLQRELNTERAARIAALRKAAAAQSPAAGSGPFDSAAANKLAADMSAQIDKEMDPQQQRNAELWKKRGELQARTPSGMLMGRVLSCLDMGVVADLPEDTRWVFATSPTRMQRPLPNAAYQAVAQFVRDQHLWSAAVKRLPFKPREGMEEDNGAPIGFYGYEEIKGAPAKVLLVLYRGRRESGISCDLQVVDSKGRIIARNGGALSIGNNEELLAARRKADKTGATKIVLSPMSKRLLDRAKSRMGMFDMNRGTSEPLAPDVREFLLHPDENEPLSTFASDFLFSYATSKSANIVACMPDSLGAMVMISARAELPSVEALKGMTDGYSDVNFDEADGWVVVHPRAFAAARAERFNRVQLGQLVRRLTAVPALKLDDWADLAQRFDDPLYDELVTLSVILVDDDFVSMSEIPSWDLLRFYGSLSPTQRRDLRNGASLALARLNGTQAAALRKIIFYSQVSSLMIGAEDGQTVPLPNEEPAQEVAPGQDAETRTEPTEALPNGLPPDAVLTFKIDSMTVASPVGKIPWMSRGMQAEELGSLLAMKDRPDAGDMGQLMDLTKFKLGVKEMLTVHLQFTPDLSYADTITSTSLGDAVVPFAQLPKDFLAAVEKTLKEYRDAMKEQNAVPTNPPVQNGNPPPR